MNAINPEHYKRLDPEPKDLQMKWNLPAFLFNAMKYIARAGFKDDPVQDLQKAIRFIEFEIERLTHE